MTISICTMGKFWPQPDGGLPWPVKAGTGYAGGVWERKQPVVVIDKVVEREREEISVIVTGVEDA